MGGVEVLREQTVQHDKETSFRVLINLVTVLRTRCCEQIVAALPYKNKRAHYYCASA
jgi:hypothetical protein